MLCLSKRLVLWYTGDKSFIWLLIVCEIIPMFRHDLSALVDIPDYSASLAQLFAYRELGIVPPFS